MNIDLPTLYLSQFITYLLLTLWLLLMGFRYQHEKALRIWGGASIMASVGVLLVVLRPVAPYWLGVDAAFMLLLAAIMLTWQGAASLENTHLPWRSGWLLWGVTIVPMLLLRGPDYFTLRTQWYGVAYIVFHLLILRTLWHSPTRQRFGYRLAIGVTLLLCGVYLMRSLLPFFDDSPKLIASPYYLGCNLLASWLEYSKLLALVFICFERLETRLYRQAMYDSLTNLFNRRAFYEHAPRFLQQQQGQPLALLVIDLDWFKRVNDTYGHLAGDDVLVYFADLLKTQLMPYQPLIGRNGGEEFVILLADSAALHAVAVADALRSTLAEASIPVHGGHQLTATISIGIACHHAPELASLQNLFMQADQALYRAKENGRNQVCTG